MSIRSVRILFAVALLATAIVLSPRSSNAQTIRLPPIAPMIPNMNFTGLAGLNFPHARCEMLLSGRILLIGEPIPKNARVMKLRIKDRLVPMVVDSDEGGQEDPFSVSLHNDYLQEVYRSMLVKEVLVEVEQSSDQAQLDNRSEWTYHERLQGCVRGLGTPIFRISSIRRAR
ncbi:MAG TPA: hypothetical protein VGI47_04680 [Candidatus Binataceae bacterium]|jgi:hypothetical protein